MKNRAGKNNNMTQVTRMNLLSLLFLSCKLNLLKKEHMWGDKFTLLACLMTRTGFLLKTRPAALIVDEVIFTLVHSLSVSADDREEVSQNHKHLMCHSRVKFWSCFVYSNVSDLKG